MNVTVTLPSLMTDTGPKAPVRHVGQSPATIRRELKKARLIAPPLEAWYRQHGREFPWRGWTDQYRLAVAEILLQRTTAKAVAGVVEQQ